jgi:hypothetical protein
MYKAESKGRVFRIGITAAILAALIGLGACDTGFELNESSEESAEETALNTGAVDANGLVAVRVNLPQKAAGRSVTTDLIDVYSDYYEVVFKVHNSDPAVYYFAKAEAGKGYLSISVKPDVAYDVLLLAGIKENRVLLATGFVNNEDGDGYDSNPATGLGYKVEANKANVIRPQMTLTNITPDDPDGSGSRSPDITFGGTSAPPGGTFDYGRDTVDKIATVTVPEKPTTFVVHLSTLQLADLTHAGFPTGGSLYFYNRATLYPRYKKHYFSVQYVGGVAGTDEFTYSFPATPATSLPDGDIDGKLRLELRYYAFGTSDSGSGFWNIRNGVDYDIDNSGSGGSIVVKFGAGSSFDEEVGVEFVLP